MTQFKVLVCFCLIVSTALFAKAEPRKSPAGGGWLQLDETHDFVDTVKAWFPNERFKELTAEAWVYIDQYPAQGAFGTIIGQEGRFHLVLFGDGTLGSLSYADRANIIWVAGGTVVPQRKWVHVVGMYNAGAGMGINGAGGNLLPARGNFLESVKALSIGGIVPQDLKKSHFRGNVKFRGYIDEVRISDVVRYAGPNYKVPKGKFEKKVQSPCGILMKHRNQTVITYLW